jgi:CRP-like cAMP-binding protein
VAIFEGIDERRLAELECVAEVRRLAGGELVFARGADCDGLYLVRDGGVVVQSKVVGEPIERVRDVGPGEVFGEIEVVDGSRRELQAVALGPSTVVRLPQHAVWTFLERHPQVETRLRTLAIYHRTQRLHALLAPATRLDPRIRIDREVQLRRPGSPAVSVRLEDLSHGGACLSAAPAGWQPGDKVRFALELPGKPDLLQLEALVRWRMRDLVGLIFEPAAAPERARQIDRALRVLLGKS